MIEIPFLRISVVPNVGYVISYMSYECGYICMSERRALAQFREDFGLKGVRLERL